jgi:hypothetical protein
MSGLFKRRYSLPAAPTTTPKNANPTIPIFGSSPDTASEKNLFVLQIHFLSAQLTVFHLKYESWF